MAPAGKTSPALSFCLWAHTPVMHQENRLGTGATTAAAWAGAARLARRDLRSPSKVHGSPRAGKVHPPPTHIPPQSSYHGHLKTHLLPLMVKEGEPLSPMGWELLSHGYPSADPLRTRQQNSSVEWERKGKKEFSSFRYEEWGQFYCRKGKSWGQSAKCPWRQEGCPSAPLSSVIPADSPGPASAGSSATHPDPAATSAPWGPCGWWGRPNTSLIWSEVQSEGRPCWEGHEWMHHGRLQSPQKKKKNKTKKIWQERVTPQ